MKKKESFPELLEIEYRPAELPSSQHRAGLAGLALLANWIKEEYVSRGICDVEIGSDSVVLYVDQLGLSELFNGLYAASREEQSRPRPMRNLRTNEIIPPLREEVRVVSNPLTGLPVRTRVCIYETIVPQGAFLAELDPSGDDETGLWLSLWREAVWTTLRAVPATRNPFAARARGEPVADSVVVWSELCRGWNYPVKVSGTSRLGAQSLTAERVPYFDLTRFKFLLNFWPLVAQIYVPVVHDAADDIDFRGFVIAVPDVRDQSLFNEHFAGMMLARGTAPYRPRPFRPEESVIGLVEEGGLDLLGRFRTQLRADGELTAVSEVLDGVDLFHLERQGNTVQSLSVTRIESDERLLDQYSKLRRIIHSPLFRRRQVSNLLNQTKRWYAGFDDLLTVMPVTRTFSNRHFRRDAAAVLARVRARDLAGWESESGRFEGIVCRLIDEYLGSKTDPVITDRSGEQRAVLIGRTRENVAHDTFLAVRARRGGDFIDYFRTVLIVKGEGTRVPSSPEILELTGKGPDELRTLTLLALVARVEGDGRRN